VKRRKRLVPHVHGDRWLVSYADFITLMFAFFVVLYSSAVIDKKKMSQVAASIQAAFQPTGSLPPPAPAPSTPATSTPSPPVVQVAPPEHLGEDQNRQDLTALRRELEAALAPEISRGEVVVHVGSEGLVVSLREFGFFDSGSSGVQARSQPALSRMAALLVQRRCRVRIEGHTDNVPIHNPQYSSNWELSTARATEMVRLLVIKYKMTPDQLSATGYAEFHPTTSNNTEGGRAKNRRVDVVILGKLQTESAQDGEPPVKSSPEWK
jgi:chemotaxis protein MotB